MDEILIMVSMATIFLGFFVAYLGHTVDIYKGHISDLQRDLLAARVDIEKLKLYVPEDKP